MGLRIALSELLSYAVLIFNRKQNINVNRTTEKTTSMKTPTTLKMITLFTLFPFGLIPGSDVKRLIVTVDWLSALKDEVAFEMGIVVTNELWNPMIIKVRMIILIILQQKMCYKWLNCRYKLLKWRKKTLIITAEWYLLREVHVLF